MVEQIDTETVYTLEELSALVLPLAAKRGINDVWVFGSYARGEATGASDIDLLVDVAGGRLRDVLGLSTEVYVATGKDPDIYDVSELLPGSFKDSVLREAVVL